jgi:hypothetical protein
LERRGTDSRVQLLLFLSALFAGFTGLISGERTAEPRHVEQAIAATAAIEAMPVATQVESAVALHRPATAPPRAGNFYPAAAGSLPGLAPVDERRLE